jgi:DMSO/TMAO reductase YedYZ molybdopterin-dependent catalytic subunit
MVDNGDVELPERPVDADVTDTAAELLAVDERDGAPVGRRVFVGLVGLGAVGVLVGAAVQRRTRDVLAEIVAKDPTGLASNLPVGGRFRIYTVTGGFPNRSREEYRLRVDGLVDRPLRLTYDDLLARTPTHLTKDFQCVTGWRVDDVEWTGVRLRELLDDAGVAPGASALRLWSFDGAYTESLTLDQARRDDVIVAYRMLGDEIVRAHGGPVRLYVAPMYGYKSLKWLERIEVTDRVVPGYWEQRGYAVDAWVGNSNGRSDEPT